MGGFRSITFVLLWRVDPVRRLVCVYFYRRLDPRLPLKDLLQWPSALPNDGLTDIVIQEPAFVSSLVGLTDVALHGGQYWSKTISKKYSSRAEQTNPDPFLSSLSDGSPEPPLHVFHSYSNTCSEPTCTMSRPAILGFSQSTAKIPPVSIFEWRFTRGWAHF